MAAGLSPDELQARARQLGFAALGVAPVGPAPHGAAFFEWLAKECAGEMSWLARNPERRADPRLVLEGARAVIVLATNYRGRAKRHPAAEGRIAQYAWGKDYHDIIAPRLTEMDRFLQTYGGTQKCYTDTGPMLERDFAALAGVGWQGKSTMLISRELGTWFFLSVILTTLELPPGKPAVDRCGGCTRCIDACPTRAITGPHQLDARRCISYLTIENKGPIPEEFRPLVGDRVYGCDECLEVCPWNRFAVAAAEVDFEPAANVHGMRLGDFLALDDEGFRTMFRGSPIKRIKRRGFLRNICVALGNVGTAADLPALERAAADPEPLIREHAAWAIKAIGQRLAAAASPSVSR